MKIRWLIKVDLTLYENDNDKLGDTVVVKVGEIDEVDIVRQDERTVALQFGNGSVGYGISTLWYEEI